LKKIYIISGERSGDMHAANLVAAMKSKDPLLQFRRMGGSYSKEVGVHLALDYASVSVMGFLEVVLGSERC